MNYEVLTSDSPARPGRAERFGEYQIEMRLRKEATKPAENVVELVAAESAHLLEDQR